MLSDVLSVSKTTAILYALTNAIINIKSVVRSVNQGGKNKPGGHKNIVALYP
jgi:hypothetical protein